MRMTVYSIVLILLAAGSWQCGSSGSSSGGTYTVTLTPVHTTWPIVREASGRWEVVGEGMFKNTGTETVVISTITVTVYDGNDAELTSRTYGPAKFDDTVVIALQSPNGNYTQISPSTSQLRPTDLGFFHVAALAPGATVPVRAGISIAFTNGRTETADVDLAVFDPGQPTIWPTDVTVGDWVAVNTAEAYHHWKGIYVYGTEIGNSERFALDIMRIDAQYKLSSPDNSPNKEDYYSWGMNILSAGSGTVVDVKANLADKAIGSYDQNNPTGNYVVIQHGPALYSFYGHMMAGSATVSIGDAVAAGQVIGKIGNSGYSTAPHVHFQYMDNRDFQRGKGLPALFWGAKVNRLSDAVVAGAVGYLPDIREQNYLLTAGTYTMDGSTPLEYDIITAP